MAGQKNFSWCIWGGGKPEKARLFPAIGEWTPGVRLGDVLVTFRWYAREAAGRKGESVSNRGRCNIRVGTFVPGAFLVSKGWAEIAGEEGAGIDIWRDACEGEFTEVWAAGPAYRGTGSTGG